MIRRTIVPLAFVMASLGVGGCATTRSVADEPSPKDEAAAALLEPETAPQAPAANGVGPATSATPPPAAAPRFIPTGKPLIIARFEKVQFPAWVERAGIRAGIKVGWAVYTSDRIITGADGRVELATAGEGRLKIGGDALVEMTQAYEFTGGQVEPSMFKVKRGAYQFTGPMVRNANAGTVVEIGDEITAIVLGGQIAGRVDGTESVMALVDGIVRVNGAKLNPGTMRQPATFLRVPRVGKASPVSAASSSNIARWVAAAQPVSGRPTLSGNSEWDVSLNSGYNQRQLEDMACRINRRGIPTEIYPVKEPGKLTWYRVVVRRFATKNDAVNFLNTAKSLGSKEPWVLVPQS